MIVGFFFGLLSALNYVILSLKVPHCLLTVIAFMSYLYEVKEKKELCRGATRTVIDKRSMLFELTHYELALLLLSSIALIYHY